MIFVFDLDDTVCDSDAYSEECIANFIKENNLPYKKVRDNTRFADEKFDWDSETSNKWYKIYGDEMMLNFPCKKNTKEVISKLKELGHTVIFATARSTDWHKDPEGISREWLKNNNINYNKLIVGRFDKELVCKEENADVFVDDDLKIVANVANSNKNTKVFLANTKYNSQFEIPNLVTRLYDFKELLDLVDKD